MGISPGGALSMETDAEEGFQEKGKYRRWFWFHEAGEAWFVEWKSDTF